MRYELHFISGLKNSLCSPSSEWVPDSKELGKVRRREERRWAPPLICRALDTVNRYNYCPLRPPGYGTCLPIKSRILFWNLIFVIQNLSKSFNVIGRDSIPPVVSCPQHQTLEITGQDHNTTVTYPPALATDNSGQNVTLLYSIPTGATFQIGTTAVTVTGVDPDGNRGYCTFKVYITKRKFCTGVIEL